MDHIDPNINAAVAVERQPKHVRAGGANHQLPPLKSAESAWLNENEVRAGRLPRWWPEAIGVVIVIVGLLAAGSGAAHGLAVGW